MIRRQRGDGSSIQKDGLPDFDFFEGEHWRVGTRQYREIRPDSPIEDVGPQILDRLRKRMDHNRSRAPSAYRVGNEGDAAHMVEMRMGDKYVVNTREFFEGQILYARSSVNEDVLVQKERRGPASRTTDSARASQYPEAGLGLHHSKTTPGLAPEFRLVPWCDWVQLP
jgi:hypothetical protein